MEDTPVGQPVCDTLLLPYLCKEPSLGSSSGGGGDALPSLVSPALTFLW